MCVLFQGGSFALGHVGVGVRFVVAWAAVLVGVVLGCFISSVPSFGFVGLALGATGQAEKSRDLLLAAQVLLSSTWCFSLAL